MEILLLSGLPNASFRHLARAWGRDKGFHMVLAQFICERRGDVERKKRERQVGNPDLPAVWDPDATSYGAVYEEALASDLLSFSQQVQGTTDLQITQHVSQQKNGLHNQPRTTQLKRQKQVGGHRESFDQEEPSYASSPMSSSLDDEQLIKTDHLLIQQSQQHGANKEYFPV
jgi:hypothetical protein